MNAELKAAKQTIRAFMRAHYTDANLIEALQHARGEKLSWHSCCCLIGIPTADHELMGFMEGGTFVEHYRQARQWPDALVADRAYMCLGELGSEPPVAMADATRRRRLIPIILAEIRRRERLRAQDNTFSDVSGAPPALSRS